MADQDSDFKVSDRRIFSKEGDLNSDQPDSSQPPAGNEPATAENPSSQPDPQEELAMTFQTLVFSLSTTAMLQLGLLANPLTGKSEKDLEGAKQTIDILQILQDKTRGNLTAEESQLLEASLYDLKMTYLKMTEKISL
jgi:hypothetical protein